MYLNTFSVQTLQIDLNAITLCFQFLPRVFQKILKFYYFRNAAFICQFFFRLVKALRTVDISLKSQLSFDQFIYIFSCVLTLYGLFPHMLKIIFLKYICSVFSLESRGTWLSVCVYLSKYVIKLTVLLGCKVWKAFKHFKLLAGRKVRSLLWIPS